MRTFGLIASCVALAACAGGASEEDGAEVSTNALVSGHGGIQGPVRVEENRLIIQRAGNEALLAGAVGRVLVGAPEPHNKDNLYGFLRRGVSAEVVDANHVAITTEAAEIGEAVTTGSVHASHDLEPAALRIVPMTNGTAAPSGKGKGLDISLGETTLTDFHMTFHDPTRLLPIGDFDVSRVVKLTHAQVHFEPSVELALSVRGGKVEHFDAFARGALEASFAITVDTKASIKLDRNAAYRETLKGNLRTPPIKVTLFQTEPYTLPPQWIGFVPVVETVRFRVLLECGIDLTSETHAEAGASVKSTAALGVRYRNGAWQPLDKPTFDAKSTFAMTQTGSVSGTCGIRSEVGFFFYDLAGPTLSVTPYLDFTVAEGTAGFDFLATPGLRGAFGGRFQVLGREFLRTDLVLFDARSSSSLKGSFGY